MKSAGGGRGRQDVCGRPQLGFCGLRLLLLRFSERRDVEGFSVFESYAYSRGLSNGKDTRSATHAFASRFERAI